MMITMTEARYPLSARKALRVAADAKSLADLEEQILKLLSASEGNILDDSYLVDTLSNSKMTSITIGQRVEVAEQHYYRRWLTLQRHVSSQRR